MRAVVPTIREILDKGGRPILLAHFGRPKGQPNPNLSLKPLAEPMADLLGSPVTYSERPRDPEPGETVLVENTRFTAMEEANDPKMAAFLASTADLYVNDAFSAAHRAHASTEGVARLMPSAAGRLMQAELEALEKALGNPARPVVAVVGGAKVSTKLDLLGNLIGKVDAIVIGGGMANTFLAAQGVDVGKSLCEHDLAETARRIADEAKAANCELILPIDVVVAATLSENAASKTGPGRGVPARPDDPRRWSTKASAGSCASLRRHVQLSGTDRLAHSKSCPSTPRPKRRRGPRPV